MRRLPPTLSGILKGFAFGAALVPAYLAVGYLGGNVAPVVEGQVWRAGQLSGGQLRRLAEAEGIRTVVNLRGPQEGVGWYDAEKAAAEGAGLTHIDVPWSARRDVTEAEAEALLAILRDAPKPVLIHCEGGADRTGLAAALYLNRVEGLPRDLAAWQLSPVFGHFGLGEKAAMLRSWDRLAR